jgi:transcriptional regulator with XRE-family HTH domain
MFSVSQIRSFFGFTQAQAGDYLMIPQSLVADYEKGIRPIPTKSVEALNVLSPLLEDFESVDPTIYSSLFETNAASEIRYWRKIAEKAQEAADDLEKELEKLDQSRLQVARVFAFTENLAEKPDSPLGLRAAWWRMQKDKQSGKIAKASEGIRRRLRHKIQLLREEARSAQENLLFWAGR